MRVLYDGWSLVYAPNGAAALHLLELLSNLAERIEAFVALPGNTRHGLKGIGVTRTDCPNTPGSLLRWEQRILPKLFRQEKADLLHIFSPTPALFGAPPTVISPVHGMQVRRQVGSGWAGRLRQALAEGALAQAKAVLWPSDLPDPDCTAPFFRLPPLALPETIQAETFGEAELVELGLPETYLLAQVGQERQSWKRTLAAWHWAAGSIGVEYPLAVLGVGASEQNEFISLARGAGLEDTLIYLPALSRPGLAALFRGCAAVLDLAEPAVWGGALRYGLAYAKPVVAVESELAQAAAGPAAYLLPEEDARRQGAALLAVVVEETLAERLSQAALRQVESWRVDTYPTALFEIYSQLS